MEARLAVHQIGRVAGFSELRLQGGESLRAPADLLVSVAGFSELRLQGTFLADKGMPFIEFQLLVSLN